MRPCPFEARAGRRRFLKRAAVLAVAGPSAAVAAERIPIADDIPVRPPPTSNRGKKPRIYAVTNIR